MNSINYQYHKFSGYILAPIRLIGFTVCTAVTIGMTAFCHKIQSDTLFHKFINFMNPLYLSIFGLKLHIEGEYNNKTPCIISSNHINLYDHFIITDVCQKLHPFLVSKKFNIFPINILTNYLQCIYTGESNISQKIKETVQNKQNIIIYPDGCDPILEDHVIAPFHKGAFIPKLPIQPIVIRYVSSLNKNMNWYYEKESNTLFSLFISYLFDSDIHVYIKVLPLQTYKESYKSYEDYQQEVYKLMENELKLLPKQNLNLSLQSQSSEYTMKYFTYLLYAFMITYMIGNLQFSIFLLMNFISGYFAHFFPTNNTRLLDLLVVTYTIGKSSFMSIQNTYDFYIRCIYIIFILYRTSRWLNYKDNNIFEEKKHISNLWIPGYLFSIYPCLLNTLELYNFI